MPHVVVVVAFWARVFSSTHSSFPPYSCRAFHSCMCIHVVLHGFLPCFNAFKNFISRFLVDVWGCRYIVAPDSAYFFRLFDVLGFVSFRLEEEDLRRFLELILCDVWAPNVGGSRLRLLHTSRSWVQEEWLMVHRALLLPVTDWKLRGPSRILSSLSSMRSAHWMWVLLDGVTVGRIRTRWP